MQPFDEPEINPLDDTSPSLAIRPVNLLSPEKPQAGWQRTAGWLSLLGAAVFTLGTLVLLILPHQAPIQENGPFIAQENTAIPTSTWAPLPQETALATIVTENTGQVPILPTASDELIRSLLLTPMQPMGDTSTHLLTGLQYEPFTVVSERRRTSVTEYIAVQGDTINLIAERYGIQPETIAWCNDRRVVQVLRPGDVLIIPPVDGACDRAIGSTTIREVAARYKVTDPYAVIDSPYNNLAEFEPDQILPSGTFVFVPGGQGELITWRPPVEEQRDANGNVIGLSFAAGQAGSCGSVAPGGGAYWSNPLPNGTWVRGYYAGHTGIDIAASPGTAILAANSGPVLFSGFNTWGYGNTVVLAHGPFSTLYGHMTSTAVRCGDYVNVGQVVGYVGSTGNSSGPHLHFEIRYNNEPMNPSGTPGIGW